MDEKKKDESPKKNLQETQKSRSRRTKKTNSSTTASQTKGTKAESTKEKSAEDKEVANLEESIHYLKTVGLKKISNKTFINEVDLAAFLEQDFSRINKTRALGFIQILEREYPVNLNDLRKAYLTYYQQNKEQEKQNLFVHAKVEHTYAWKKYLLWIIPIILFLVTMWYLNNSDKSELSVLESEDKVVSTDINSDVISKAEYNMIKFEENNSDSEVINSPRVSAFHRDQKSKMVTSTIDTNIATEMKNEDVDLDAMVKQMVQEYNLSVEKEIVSSKGNETIVLEQNMTETIPTKIIPPKKKITKSKKVQKSINGAINSKLYIKPRKKSWVGIIYLDDYTKKDFLIRKTLKLNSTRPQLIVVGQKEFEILNNGYSYRFRGKGPVRFIYKDGDIMEITNQEFRKYSKGTAW